MNKFVRLNGHNPDSKAAKERERKRQLLTIGAVKCCKCGRTNNTLYKMRIRGEKVYICNACLDIMTAKERKEKYGR